MMRFIFRREPRARPLGGREKWGGACGHPGRTARTRPAVAVNKGNNELYSTRLGAHTDVISGLGASANLQLF